MPLPASYQPGAAQGKGFEQIPEPALSLDANRRLASVIWVVWWRWPRSGEFTSPDDGIETCRSEWGRQGQERLEMTTGGPETAVL